MTVAVVIVNYKGGQMVIDTISRLAQSQSAELFKLYVVDNGSHGDSSRRWLLEGGLEALMPGPTPATRMTVREEVALGYERMWESATKWVSVEESVASHRFDVMALDRNYGYEVGVNLGIMMSRGAGSDLILMGSDVLTMPGMIEALQRTACDDEKIGVVGAKLMKTDQSGRLFVVGGGYTDDPKCLHLRGYESDPGPWNEYQHCPWVTFSVVYVKRALVKAIGLMDMSFWFYAGDNDYCRRARNAGFASVYCPDAKALHAESITVGLVKREIGEDEWKRRRDEESAYFHNKWDGRHAPMVQGLPAKFKVWPF